MTVAGVDHFFTRGATISLGGIVLLTDLCKSNISLPRGFDFYSFRSRGSSRYSLLYYNEGFSVRERPISIFFLAENSLASSYPIKRFLYCSCHWSYPRSLHASANFNSWLVSADRDVNSSFFHCRVIFKYLYYNN